MATHCDQRHSDNQARQALKMIKQIDDFLSQCAQAKQYIRKEQQIYWIKASQQLPNNPQRASPQAPQNKDDPDEANKQEAQAQGNKRLINILQQFEYLRKNSKKLVQEMASKLINLINQKQDLFRVVEDKNQTIIKKDEELAANQQIIKHLKKQLAYADELSLKRSQQTNWELEIKHEDEKKKLQQLIDENQKALDILKQDCQERERKGIQTTREQMQIIKEYEEKINILSRKVEDDERLLRESQQERRCCICMVFDSNVVFEPCRHLCSCLRCSKNVRNCPMCRKLIVKKQKVFST